ncbi:VOC family protein [Haloquadratum walsbyi]|nr:VOC family protein [Haloquadratum walsbyi]
MTSTPSPTLHHIGITVDVLEEMVDFYTETLNLDILTRFNVGDEAFATAVDVPNAHAEFVHLDTGDGRLELVSYTPSNTQHTSVGLNTSGTVHIGVTVEDIDAVYASLPDDVKTVSSPQTTDTGTRVCFLRDPESNLVELLSI